MDYKKKISDIERLIADDIDAINESASQTQGKLNSQDRTALINYYRLFRFNRGPADELDKLSDEEFDKLLQEQMEKIEEEKAKKKTK